MPRSMTGYGAARATGKRVSVEVEARSVNAKSRKISLRNSSLLASHEPELESLIRQQVRRGSIQVSVRLEHLRPQDAVQIHAEIVEGIAKALEPLRKRGLVEGRLSADAIVQIPGAVEMAARDPLSAADWRIVRATVKEALDSLNAMRGREAVHLVKDLKRILKGMRKAVAMVRRRTGQVVKEQQAKIRDRVDALLQDEAITLDPTTLAREIALWADRSDVTEEVTRLDAHLDEFEAYLLSENEIGRTLDFLAQEMLRESNTIGSKSQDVEIARAVITLKSETERLKEQVANLE